MVNRHAVGPTVELASRFARCGNGARLLTLALGSAFWAQAVASRTAACAGRNVCRSLRIFLKFEHQDCFAVCHPSVGPVSDCANRAIRSLFVAV